MWSGISSRRISPLTESTQERPLTRDEARDIRSIANAARPRRHVKLHALCIQGAAGDRHPVFPAVERTEPKPVQIEGTQPVAIAGRPHQPLLVRRHQFAMHIATFALIVYGDQRAVQAVSAVLRRALNRARNHPDPGRPSQRRTPEPDLRVLSERPAQSNARTSTSETPIRSAPIGEFYPKRITRHKGLAEHG
jgi:hypothetical protein